MRNVGSFILSHFSGSTLHIKQQYTDDSIASLTQRMSFIADTRAGFIIIIFTHSEIDLDELVESDNNIYNSS